MRVAKNINISRKRRELDTRGDRLPALDKLCPSCKVRGFGERLTFAYRMNVSGRSSDVHWCSWEQREVA